MSFILDALRKSEHERQRTAMPGITQVPFGLPRRELPPWTISVIVVLVLAVLALGGAWWRSSKSGPAANAEPDVAARAELPLALPPASVATPPAAVFGAPQGGAAAERAVETPAPSSQRLIPLPPQRRTAAAASTPFATDDRSADESEAGAPEDPAASDALTLPSAAALAAEGVTLPKLRLELHAYSPRPTDRFVFINGAKYLEGATLAEGPRLVTIAPNGAVLVYLGRRFLLAPQ